MKILAINTVGDVCEAALVDGTTTYISSKPMTRGHDVHLAPLVDDLMKSADCAMKSIDRLCVVVGPGSFTGVRVGISFARGLGVALDIPVIGITSLEALGATKGRTLAALPAKRRPPDLSWWAQTLVDGLGEGECIEATESELADIARKCDHTIGNLPEFAGKPLTLQPDDAPAIIAARLAEHLTTEDHPARPVYVREPDATPMAQRT